MTHAVNEKVMLKSHVALQPEELAAELSVSLSTTGSFPGGMRDKGGSRLLRTALGSLQAAIRRM